MFVALVRIKQEIVDVSKALRRPELMEAKFNSLSNAAFHFISADVRREIGIPSSEMVFPRWKKWLLEAVDKFSV